MLIGSFQLPVRWDSVVQYLQAQDFSVALYLCSLAGLGKQDIPMVLSRHYQPCSKRQRQLKLSKSSVQPNPNMLIFTNTISSPPGYQPLLPAAVSLCMLPPAPASPQVNGAASCLGLSSLHPNIQPLIKCSSTLSYPDTALATWKS